MANGSADPTAELVRVLLVAGSTVHVLAACELLLRDRSGEIRQDNRLNHTSMFLGYSVRRSAADALKSSSNLIVVVNAPGSASGWISFDGYFRESESFRKRCDSMTGLVKRRRFPLS